MTSGMPMKQNSKKAARSGFTLVELLTVIAIIGMLSAISITTVSTSIRTAKETQTRTTIAKIDNIITTSYEKYQYRRVDMTIWDLDEPGKVDLTSNVPRFRAEKRLAILRDLLRCDFPCTLQELSTVITEGPDSGRMTPIQEAILIATGTTPGAGGSRLSADDRIANAELLYQVVMNGDPDTRASFSQREIGDVDGNGLNEFIDGWGNPICWMRWAPSLPESDRQPLIDSVAPHIDAGEEIDPYDADPLDPLGVGIRLNPRDTSPDAAVVRGWFLVPYIYSFGPDGIGGLVMPDRAVLLKDPFRPASGSDPGTRFYGAPVVAGDPEENAYKDNIDNHTLVR